MCPFIVSFIILWDNICADSFVYFCVLNQQSQEKKQESCAVIIHLKAVTQLI